MKRKDFLRVLLGAPVFGAVSGPTTSALHQTEPVRNASREAPVVDQGKTSTFSEQVADDVGRTMLGALSYLGDRLGLFKTMAEMDQFTAKDLARATGYNQRLLEQWLNGMVSLQYVLYDSVEKRFSFPPEHAAVLVDEDSPFFMAGGIEYAIPAVLAIHHVMEAFRTGVPITPDVFHPDIWEGIERWSRPMYRHQLVQNWLPLIPDVLNSLQAGAFVADVGCGNGQAMITIARAFPNTRTQGFDVYAPSIEKARRNAREAGVEDRAEFIVGGTGDLPKGKFDLVTNFAVVHHYSHPVKEMKAIRQALGPNGSYLILEDSLSSEPNKNIKPAGRIAYGASTLACLHDSMANDGVGLGTVNEDVVRRLGQQSGFGFIRRLPLDDPYSALFQLKV
ncbi:MAG: class I SAM-dependent methyltransferase [Acidobacteriota bacterium]|nr:MAG: class I SAM-dependent methyltransferase [Acidobacteriota bacterium]